MSTRDVIPTQADLPDSGAFIGAIPYSFPCPRCGNEFNVALGAFENSEEFTCGSCKQTIAFDADQFRSAVEEFRSALERLWQSTGYVVYPGN